MTDTRFVRGAERVRRRIATITANTQIALNSGLLESLLLRRVKERFLRGVDADGRPWPPLRPSTVRRKKGKAAPLQRSGDLFKAIAVIRGSNQGTFASATGAGFRIGIEDPEIAEYARLMNNGFWHARAKRMIPPRRFLGVGALDRKAVDSALRNAIINRNLEG